MCFKVASDQTRFDGDGFGVVVALERFIRSDDGDGDRVSVWRGIEDGVFQRGPESSEGSKSREIHGGADSKWGGLGRLSTQSLGVILDA